MSAEDSLKKAAVDTFNAVNIKRRYIKDMQVKIDRMKIEIVELEKEKIRWEHEVTDMESHARSLEKQAADAKASEHKLRNELLKISALKR